jgi:N-acetylglucosaminyl-diphospho-decaprenol L-rhamnosyltransferase
MNNEQNKDGFSTQLAVVIISWNVRDLLARCLDSLFRDLDSSQIDSRVLVIDNASMDGSVEMIREKFPHVELTASEKNLGFAGGNNLGLALLGFKDLALFHVPFILLLNPDTEIQPGAIKSMLAFIEANPQAAVVTSSLSYGDGSFQHSAFHFPGLTQLYMELLPYPARFYESRLNGRYARKQYDDGKPFEIDHPLGAVMLVRSEAIEQCGLLDEGFTLYCEEVDWCARFKEADWKNYCVPSAEIIHHSAKSTSQVRVESFEKLWRARYRLHIKHPRFALMLLARLIVILGMRRKMRGASEEMRAACQLIIDVWTGKLNA